MTIRLFIRYRGTDFNGWQVQNRDGKPDPDAKTIQGALNDALRELLGTELIKTVGCSRTDAGVHALEYCVSFDVEAPAVPPDRIAPALNHLLPERIRAVRSEEAPPGFNARRDTVKKTYVYYFYWSEDPVPVLDTGAWFIKSPLPPDVKLMRAAAAEFKGTHDFAAFSGALDPKKDTVREIFECSAEELPPPLFMENVKLYALTITGNGFLYNMVRIIAGTVAEAGLGKRTPENVRNVILRGKRKDAGVTAPPNGLYLARIFLGDVSGK
ncbi:MAG: tRNA pseudouridine(38-40) synthase TruA [Clostridia bacterium]|nr:tRNA pseudouridine(38-40) synthase TruA [Clostridia bacterium]